MNNLKFEHCPPKELLELTTESINGRRHYVTPAGKFPSITTVLGSFPNPALIEWRKRVGEVEANRISNTASSRGTKLHLLAEKYLSNEEINKKEFMPDALSSFYSFKPILDNINRIHKLEVPLYSNKLKVAGRCDAIAEYEGELSIIDFKTSKKEKKEEWIENYFIQATFYGLCYAELTGIVAKNIVILIAVDDGESQVFVKPMKEYVPKTIKKIKEYYRLYH
jgi:genome maintenance exonuclease 1